MWFESNLCLPKQSFKADSSLGVLFLISEKMVNWHSCFGWLTRLTVVSFFYRNLNQAKEKLIEMASNKFSGKKKKKQNGGQPGKKFDKKKHEPASFPRSPGPSFKPKSPGPSFKPKSPGSTFKPKSPGTSFKAKKNKKKPDFGPGEQNQPLSRRQQKTLDWSLRQKARLKKSRSQNFIKI